MGEAHVGPLLEGLKHCPVCAEPINKLAWKCIHCQSELGAWRRRLSVSSSVLALLVALVSVVGATAPTIIESLRSKNSVAFILEEATDKKISVFASNVGTRQAVVSTGEISLPNETILLASAKGPVIVNPGQTQLLDFVLSDAVFYMPVDLPPTKAACPITLRAVDVEGEKFTQLTTECGRLYPFIYTIARKSD
jgi:predicted nucleic acid-binding Zn ribbon protein